MRKIRLNVLLIISFGFLASCEKDLKEDYSVSGHDTTLPNVKTRMVTDAELSGILGKLTKELNVEPPKNSDLNSQFSINNSLNIDTSGAILTENEFDHKSYSFRVMGESFDDKLENIVYLERNGTVEVKKITYNFTSSFAEDYYNDLKSFKDFEGTINILNLTNDNCCANQPSDIIIGGGGSGDQPGSGYTGGSYTGGGWGIGIGSGGYTSGGSSGGSGSGGTGSGGTGSGSSGGVSAPRCPSGMHYRGAPECRYTQKDNSPIVSNRIGGNNNLETNSFDEDNPRELCCIYDIAAYEEALFNSDCDKLKKLFERNPTLQTELSTLAGKTADSVENGFYKLSSGANIEQVPPGTHGGVDFPESPPGKYELMAHTHNSPSESTYSIYSYHDILWIADKLKKDKIKPSKFTSFLSTADGTHYALTISDINKFKKSFSTIFDGAIYDSAAALRREEAKIKYYEGKNPNSISDELIKAANTDLEMDALYFVKMLAYMDCGLSIFETDSNFTNFQKLELNNTATGLERKPCEN